MKQVLAITKKEIEGYFGSPMALIFVGVFLAATLFVFFWWEPFFARGIADVRPLFSAMPLLLILLVSALTMRQWSEEQRSGTLEVLLTLPVGALRLILAKFLAVMALVALALALTLTLPLTVFLLGNLDWGPVLGGYLAALLLAAAYAAIGLFASSLTDNQIVALLLTVLLCGLFLLAGTSLVTGFVGETAGEVLRAIGSGSRFESIQRGVIDLRDLVYYLALTGIFLTLNVLSLEAKRWSRGARALPQRRALLITSLLVIVNLIVVNVWLYPLRGLRVDITAQREYSLSRATRDLLATLEEPLLIRGYFSERTHPLLAPLVPRVRDMLREYQIAGGDMVQLEIVDPADEPELEAEAYRSYGISPTPFQVAGRYETSIINAYFDILIRYGDQSIVLNFRDLIAVDYGRDSVNVRLRNLEYDLTRAIRKVVYGFQSVESMLAALDEPARLTVFVTPSTLPDWLAEVPATIESVAADIAGQSPNFSYEIIDLDAPNSRLSRQDMLDGYGIKPYAVSLFSDQTYYLHILLEVGEQKQWVYPSGELTEADIRTAIEAAIKRLSPGFLQVVGLWTPPATPTQDMFGQMRQPISSWQQVTEALRQEYEVRTVDLTSGQVPADIDVLVLIAPQGMTDVERYAVDQYLMRGGSVVVAAGSYGIDVDYYTGSLMLPPLEDGLHDLLSSYGITVERALVLDLQNTPFPVTVNRNVGGGVVVQEIRAVDYPYFVDVRSDGMDAQSSIVSNLTAVTLNWASPITIDEEANAERQVDILLRSSPDSWVITTTTMVEPNYTLYPESGFPISDERQSYVLAVAVRGVFESAFRGQPSPLGENALEEGEEAPPAAPIETSPETARLVVIGSSEFVDDVVLDLASTLGASRDTNTSLKLMQNAVAWSTEDLDLLAIRARGTQSRVLAPLSEGAQRFWEVLNYVLALLALVVIGVVWSLRRRSEQPMTLVMTGGEAR